MPLAYRVCYIPVNSLLPQIRPALWQQELVQFKQQNCAGWTKVNHLAADIVSRDESIIPHTAPVQNDSSSVCKLLTLRDESETCRAACMPKSLAFFSKFQRVKAKCLKVPLFARNFTFPLEKILPEILKLLKPFKTIQEQYNQPIYPHLSSHKTKELLNLKYLHFATKQTPRN